MKLELIKSWLLTGLVLLSVILFWNLVTFQQNYDSIPNPGYATEVTIAETKEMPELFMPNKVIYRKDSESFAGTENMKDIHPFVEEIRKWEYYDFQNATSEMRDLFLNKKDNRVLIFQYPDDIPLELTKSLFKVSNEVPKDHFTHILIFPNQFHDDEGIVYFTNSEFTSSVKARVRYHYMEGITTLIDQFLLEARSYIAYEKNNGDYLFVLGEESTISNLRFYPTNIDIEKFVDALFIDPTLVSKKDNQYTDTSSVLKVYENTGMLEYVDLTVTDSYISLKDMVSDSVDFINEHSGWTDRFYYVYSDPLYNEIIYQLYMSDYPVMHDNGNSQFKLEINNGGIYRYDRPYFTLDVSFSPVSNKSELSSGYKVMDYLDSLERININDIDDLLIGYRMVKRKGPYIDMEPSWFFRMGSNWERISEEEIEGDMDGLE